MTELIGTVGALCFALSGLPAAYEAIKAGFCSYSRPFLWLWLAGELCLMFYSAQIGAWTLWVNYLPNLLCLLVLFYYNTSKKD